MERTHLIDRPVVKIDRRTWNTGERYAEPQLVTEMREKYERCFCCLALLGMACGVSEGDMVDVAMPSDIPTNPWPKALFELAPFFYESTEIREFMYKSEEPIHTWADAFAAINDAANVDDETRESWISTGFDIVFDMDVEFTGQYGEDQTEREDFSEDYYDDPPDADAI